MNEFSQSFIEKLATDFNQYVEYIINAKVLSDGSINISIPSPIVEDLNVLISTELNELIIGYDGVHWHFGADKSESLEKSYREFSSKFIEILEEDLICCEYKEKLITKHNFVSRTEYMKLRNKGKVSKSYSWSGTYNYNA